MLETVSNYNSLEDAAKHCAGNWKNWAGFAWFGQDLVPKSHNVMLGYTTGREPSVTDMANEEVVREALKPRMGNMAEDSEATVEDFSSSAYGESNALRGFMVRVYDDKGNITEAFEKLFELGKQRNDDPILDREVYEKINRRELMRYLNLEIPDICEEKNLQYDEKLIVSATDVLINEMEADFDYVEDEQIEKLVEELAAQKV